jgi:hypothetical protein
MRADAAGILGAAALAALAGACSKAGSASDGDAAADAPVVAPDDGGAADTAPADAACATFVAKADEPRWPPGGDGPSSLIVDRAAGTATDGATGLVFELAPRSQLTFDAAACRCTNLRTAGASDWRLASRYELDHLVDYVKAIKALDGPAFDPSIFPTAAIDEYWTSTLYASDNPAQTNVPYYVTLGDGTAVGAAQTGQELASGWCVRGGDAPPASARFTTTASTVTDTWTKLVWQKAIPAEARGVDHAGAAAYCAGLTLDGAGDFRIPGVKELQTLVAAGRRAPSIDTGLFPDTPSDIFHTNAPYSAQPNDTWWFVDFTDGSAIPTTVAPSSSRNAEPVRCVRSLP